MKKLIFSVFILTFLLVGCKSQDVIWGYGVDNGPDKWAELSTDYATCGNGNIQSPINVETESLLTGDDNLEFNYNATDFDVIDTGHSIEFMDESEQNYIEYDEEIYNLEQIHFHNESENTLDGKHYPLEAHFVHANEAGENLVISVMFEIGEKNNTIGDSFTKVSEQITLNPYDLIPEGADYYSFLGSLTTPPCTENVRWLIFNEPLSISEQQLQDFTTYYSNNNRDVQEVNDREIVID